MKHYFYPLIALLFFSAISFSQVVPNFNYTQSCYGEQTTLVASSALPNASILSWQWDTDNNGEYDVSGEKIIYLFTPSNDTAVVKLKITSKSGSADSITKNVIINPLPQVNFRVDNLCERKTAKYFNQSTIASGTITQFLWDFNNDNITDDNSNDTVTYNCGQAQTYITKLICISDKGCSAFATKTTEVFPNPIATFSTTSTCLNTNAIFTNTSTVINPDFYLWNFGDGNQSVGNSTHIYNSPGTFTVTLIAVTQNGCRDTVASSITINPLPSVAITSSGSTIFCAGNTVTLNAGSGFASYLWNNGSSSQSISVSSSGNNNVVVTDVNGCTNTASVSVTSTPLPVVTITTSGNTVLSDGNKVMLIANGANSYAWSTGANSISITVTQSGTYFVKGTDINNCTASDSIIIMNKISDTVFVSGNLLTPNGDGINDFFSIQNIMSYQNCNVKVYSIWNEEVFSATNYKNNWDGTYSGNPLPAGAYYYIIKCDDKAVARGNINILR
ncbi:MAG: gliding motility-associated C-terminal domain-containing protein [Bacteroidota bacterium]